MMIQHQKKTSQKGALAAFMNLVEQGCNKLPPPGYSFLPALCPDRPFGCPLYGNGSAP